MREEGKQNGQQGTDIIAHRTVPANHRPGQPGAPGVAEKEMIAEKEIKRQGLKK